VHHLLEDLLVSETIARFLRISADYLGLQLSANTTKES
jgi:hypothetical protein